ncbi:hypothetical protein MMC26_006228 [Xylographa opegraphella]|nr:hypothetical protein [Xylographa opegraphella]
MEYEDGGYSRSDYETTDATGESNHVPPLLAYPSSTHHQRRPFVNTSFPYLHPETRPNGFSSESPSSASHIDPHDYYRRRDTHKRDSRQSYVPAGGMGNNGDGGVVTARSAHRTSITYSSPLVSSFNHRSDAPSPISGRIANSPLNPPVGSTTRTRKSSLQDRINKFEKNRDEIPPLPVKQGIRTMSTTSSVNTNGAKPFRARTPTDKILSTYEPNGRSSLSGSEQGSNSPLSPRRRRAMAENSPSTHIVTRTPKIRRNPPTYTNNTYASQSMTDLSPARSNRVSRPLFGEILPITSPSHVAGYGILSSRHRRGSEGSMHTPNPMFAEDQTHTPSGISPSSPTDWSRNQKPTLEGIDLDKPVPARPPGMHRRSRSDFSSSYPRIPLSSSGKKDLAILSPTEEVITPFVSPIVPKRHSQSRIPVSNHRLSVTSDSGNSSSSIAPSASSQYAGYGRQPIRASNVLPISNSGPKSASPDSHKTPSPSRRTPTRRNLSPLRQSHGTSPRLAAYISEAQPLKSPPLRASRTRQSVATATTLASRARAVDRPASSNRPSTGATRDRSSRTLPDSAGVDIETRRQLILGGYSKSIREKRDREAMDAERKRSSMLYEAKMQAAALNSSSSIPEGSIPEGSIPEGSIPEGSTELSIDTSHIIDRSILNLSQEDSPTLGTASRFLGPTPPSESEPDPEPSSAVTAGTTETFFDNDPQEGDPRFLNEHRTLLDSVRNLREPSPNDSDMTGPLSSRHLPQLEGALSDREDEGSIEIMLGVTPVMESATSETHQLPAPTFDTHAETALDRWSADSWTSDRTNSQIVDENRSEGPTHVSLATTISGYNTMPWSPESANSILSGRTTMDSESYNPINRLLDSYHDPMSPEDIRDFEQRMKQSPNLARAGGWDPQKVTQLYLLSLGRSPYNQTSQVPEPLRFMTKSAAEQSMNSVLAETPQESFEAQVEETVQDNDRQYEESQNEVDEEVIVPQTRESLEVKEMLNPQRASLNQPDDWANTSPSMLDWIHHQALDTPIDEKPLPVPKSWTGEALDLAGKSQDQRSRPFERSVEGHPQLPEIRRSESGLGININIESPHEPKSPVTPYILRSNEPSSLPSSEEKHHRIHPPVSGNPSPPTPKIYNKYQTSNISTTSAPDIGYVRKGMHDTSYKTEPINQTASASASTSRSLERPSYDGPSVSSDPAARSISPSPHPDQKRLTRRRHILKELIDTEYSYGQDMTVVNDIYKGTSQIITNPDDVKTLFGNSDQIVEFSTMFLDALKQGGKSVYVLPKAKRWRSKRDSEVTSASGTTTDDQSSISGMDLSDSEKDRKTFIGSVFHMHMSQMEKVYGDYLRNHDAANQTLQRLLKIPEIRLWLTECTTWAHDLTTAWDLDSLLVKPVQRILKYPLLLKELVEVTPENHPDFNMLDTVAREMVGVSKRINDMKKRADLVGQVAGTSKKRKDFEGRVGLKAFTRRTEKFKQQVGLSDNVQDEAYDHVAEKFGMHFFQVQVVMRDIEMYTNDVQTYVSRFNDFLLAIEAHMDVAQSTYHEVESKWRKFRMSMREVQTTALPEHIAAIRELVVRPMSLLLLEYNKPQILMERRKKRVLDYAKFKTMKERGDKVDRKTSEAADLFTAVNDALKDELPKFFALTGKLVRSCLENFVQLQMQWQVVWKKKLGQALEDPEPHLSDQTMDQYMSGFRGDFEIVESQVLTLGICNGSVLAEAANLINFLTPMTSLGGDGTSSPRRPSINTNDSRTRGYSASTNVSPMLPQQGFGDRPNEGYVPASYLSTNGIYQPGTDRRVRAGSNASGRSPVAPDLQGNWRAYSNSTTPVNSHHNRPSTSTSRTADPSSLPRGSVDSIGYNRYSGDSHGAYRPSSSSNYHVGSRGPQGRASSPSDRQSSIFNSAMPMSDSPPQQSPVGAHHDEKQPNVLFLAASVYEFNIDRARREAGYPYLTYVAGEIFDVVAEKGELWLAKNQDDASNTLGWIWNKHFAKLAS